MKETWMVGVGNLLFYEGHREIFLQEHPRTYRSATSAHTHQFRCTRTYMCIYAYTDVPGYMVFVEGNRHRGSSSIPRRDCYHFT